MRVVRRAQGYRRIAGVTIGAGHPVRRARLAGAYDRVTGAASLDAPRAAARPALRAGDAGLAGRAHTGTSRTEGWPAASHGWVRRLSSHASMRNQVEQKILTISRISDAADRKYQLDLSAQQLREETDEIQARMQERGWKGIAYTKLIGIFAGALELADAGTGGLVSLAIGGASLGLAATAAEAYKDARSKPDWLGEPMAYAALAQGKFIARVVQGPLIGSSAVSDGHDHRAVDLDIDRALAVVLDLLQVAPFSSTLRSPTSLQPSHATAGACADLRSLEARLPARTLATVSVRAARPAEHASSTASLHLAAEYDDSMICAWSASRPPWSRDLAEIRRIAGPRGVSKFLTWLPANGSPVSSYSACSMSSTPSVERPGEGR